MDELLTENGENRLLKDYEQVVKLLDKAEATGNGVRLIMLGSIADKSLFAPITIELGKSKDSEKIYLQLVGVKKNNDVLTLIVKDEAEIYKTSHGKWLYQGLGDLLSNFTDRGLKVEVKPIGGSTDEELIFPIGDQKKGGYLSQDFKKLVTAIEADQQNPDSVFKDVEIQKYSHGVNLGVQFSDKQRTNVMVVPKYGEPNKVSILIESEMETIPVVKKLEELLVEVEIIQISSGINYLSIYNTISQINPEISITKIKYSVNNVTGAVTTNNRIYFNNDPNSYIYLSVTHQTNQYSLTASIDALPQLLAIISFFPDFTRVKIADQEYFIYAGKLFTEEEFKKGLSKAFDESIPSRLVLDNDALAIDTTQDGFGVIWSDTKQTGIKFNFTNLFKDHSDFHLDIGVNRMFNNKDRYELLLTFLKEFIIQIALLRGRDLEVNITNSYDSRIFKTNLFNSPATQEQKKDMSKSEKLAYELVSKYDEIELVEMSKEVKDISIYSLPLLRYKGIQFTLTDTQAGFIVIHAYNIINNTPDENCMNLIRKIFDYLQQQVEFLPGWLRFYDVDREVYYSLAMNEDSKLLLTPKNVVPEKLINRGFSEGLAKYLSVVYEIDDLRRKNRIKIEMQKSTSRDKESHYKIINEDNRDYIFLNLNKDGTNRYSYHVRDEGKTSPEMIPILQYLGPVQWIDRKHYVYFKGHLLDAKKLQNLLEEFAVIAGFNKSVMIVNKIPDKVEDHQIYFFFGGENSKVKVITGPDEYGVQREDAITELMQSFANMLGVRITYDSGNAEGGGIDNMSVTPERDTIESDKEPIQTIRLSESPVLSESIEANIEQTYRDQYPDLEVGVVANPEKQIYEVYVENELVQLIRITEVYPGLSIITTFELNIELAITDEIQKVLDASLANENQFVLSFASGDQKTNFLRKTKGEPDKQVSRTTVLEFLLPIMSFDSLTSDEKYKVGETLLNYEFITDKASNAFQKLIASNKDIVLFKDIEDGNKLKIMRKSPGDVLEVPTVKVESLIVDYIQYLQKQRQSNYEQPDLVEIRKFSENYLPIKPMDAWIIYNQGSDNKDRYQDSVLLSLMNSPQDNLSYYQALKAQVKYRGEVYEYNSYVMTSDGWSDPGDRVTEMIRFLYLSIQAGFRFSHSTVKFLEVASQLGVLNHPQIYNVALEVRDLVIKRNEINSLRELLEIYKDQKLHVMMNEQFWLSGIKKYHDAQQVLTAEAGEQPEYEIQFDAVKIPDTLPLPSLDSFVYPQGLMQEITNYQIYGKTRHRKSAVIGESRILYGRRDEKGNLRPETRLDSALSRAGGLRKFRDTNRSMQLLERQARNLLQQLANKYNYFSGFVPSKQDVLANFEWQEKIYHRIELVLEYSYHTGLDRMPNKLRGLVNGSKSRSVSEYYANNTFRLQKLLESPTLRWLAVVDEEKMVDLLVNAVQNSSRELDLLFRYITYTFAKEQLGTRNNRNILDYLAGSTTINKDDYLTNLVQKLTAEAIESELHTNKLDETRELLENADKFVENFDLNEIERHVQGLYRQHKQTIEEQELEQEQDELIKDAQKNLFDIGRELLPSSPEEVKAFISRLSKEIGLIATTSVVMLMIGFVIFPSLNTFRAEVGSQYSAETVRNINNLLLHLPIPGNTPIEDLNNLPTFYVGQELYDSLPGGMNRYYDITELEGYNPIITGEVSTSNVSSSNLSQDWESHPLVSEEAYVRLVETARDVIYPTGWHMNISGVLVVDGNGESFTLERGLLGEVYLPSGLQGDTIVVIENAVPRDLRPIGMTSQVFMLRTGIDYLGDRLIDVGAQNDTVYAELDEISFMLDNQSGLTDVNLVPSILESIDLINQPSGTSEAGKTALQITNNSYGMFQEMTTFYEQIPYNIYNFEVPLDANGQNLFLWLIENGPEQGVFCFGANGSAEYPYELLGFEGIGITSNSNVVNEDGEIVTKVGHYQLLLMLDGVPVVFVDHTPGNPVDPSISEALQVGDEVTYRNEFTMKMSEIVANIINTIGINNIGAVFSLIVFASGSFVMFRLFISTRKLRSLLSKRAADKKSAAEIIEMKKGVAVLNDLIKQDLATQAAIITGEVANVSQQSGGTDSSAISGNSPAPLATAGSTITVESPNQQPTQPEKRTELLPLEAEIVKAIMQIFALDDLGNWSGERIVNLVEILSKLDSQALEGMSLKYSQSSEEYIEKLRNRNNVDNKKTDYSRPDLAQLEKYMPSVKNIDGQDYTADSNDQAIITEMRDSLFEYMKFGEPRELIIYLLAYRNQLLLIKEQQIIAEFTENSTSYELLRSMTMGDDLNGLAYTKILELLKQTDPDFDAQNLMQIKFNTGTGQFVANRTDMLQQLLLISLASKSEQIEVALEDLDTALTGSLKDSPIAGKMVSNRRQMLGKLSAVDKQKLAKLASQAEENPMLAKLLVQMFVG